MGMFLIYTTSREKIHHQISSWAKDVGASNYKAKHREMKTKMKSRSKSLVSLNKRKSLSVISSSARVPAGSGIPKSHHGA